MPTNWGVATAFNSVYYNYGTFFGYCVLLGEICKQNNKLDLNPFFERSETITVASFGFDNIVTFMINTYNHALSIPGYKSFDYYLPNKFLTLNGQKFSTSRNHAVWVEKLPNSISIDIIRLFLLKQNADSKSNDFDIYQFSTFYNAIASDINSKVIGKLSFIYQKKIVIPDEIRNYFFDLMNARLSYSMPENYDASKICANIQEWLRYSENISNGNYYWWLKAFSILSFSVMPNLAVVLWQVLGGQEVPKLINFLDYTRPIPNANITPFELISPSKIVLG